MKNMPQEFQNYIATFDEDIKKRFLKIRSLVFKECEDVFEKMSYGVPSFFYKGLLLHIGLFKNHLSLFPSPDTILYFKPRLGEYKLDKGTIRMPYQMSLEEDLISDIIKYNINRNNKS